MVPQCAPITAGSIIMPTETKKMAPKRSFKRFGEDRAHYEGAEGGGEADGIGESHHAEAKPDGDNKQRFVVEKRFNPFQQGWDDVDADQKPQDEEECEFAKCQKHLASGEMAGCREGGQQDHQQDCDEVFDDEDTENQLGVGLVFQPHVAESLYDDRGGRHRQQTAEEDALHHRPVEELARQKPRSEHSDAVDSGYDKGRTAHLQQLLEAEIESQSEEQEDDSKF